jgi:hypothetical protein
MCIFNSVYVYNGRNIKYKFCYDYITNSTPSLVDADRRLRGASCLHDPHHHTDDGGSYFL